VNPIADKKAANSGSTCSACLTALVLIRSASRTDENPLKRVAARDGS
jgi:hypothetical protein